MRLKGRLKDRVQILHLSKIPSCFILQKPVYQPGSISVGIYGEPFVPKLQMASVNLQSLVQNYQSLVLIHNR